MDHRIAGIALLAVAALVIVAVPVISGRVVPGEATAAPVAPSPEVGDCLAENPHDGGNDLSSWSIDLPSVRLEPCTGPRYGEVVSVAPGISNAESIETVPRLFFECTEQVYQYLGLPDQSVNNQDLFQPVNSYAAAVVGPDIRQRSDGQSWSACVAYPGSKTRDQFASFPGSLRGIWNREAESRAFASCTENLDFNLTMTISCQGPHRYELFGRTDLGTVGSIAPEQELDPSCRELIAASTGMPDITGGGALTVRVIADRFNDDGTAPIGPDAVGFSNYDSFSCAMTPTDDARHLTASLRSLGDGPIPLN